jgi:hypothetical protein
VELAVWRAFLFTILTKESEMKRTVLALAVLLCAGTSYALPMNTSGFTWVDAPYWTLTDTTTGADGSADFVLFFEHASYESDFGLFTVDSPTNPTMITDTFEVFSYNTEPFSFTSVYFQDTGSGWEISKDASSWTAFDNIFGFYFAVHTGGLNDATADYYYYSDTQFNQPLSEIGAQHIATEWDGVSRVFIYLDDQLIAKADQDWNDMKVYGVDLTPVPEPATMVLLGSGLLGIAGISRRRKKA